MLHIRTYRDEDQGAVIALWHEAGLLVNPLNDPVADIRFCRESGHGDILVHDVDGEIDAVAMVGHEGHRGWVYYVATAPDKRGQGLGRLIMHAAERWLRDKGAPKVQLIVRSTNTQVIGFYQRLGYVVEPRELMSKRLDGNPVPMGGGSSDEPVVITYLEMTAHPALPHIEPHARMLALLRLNEPTVSFYRYLYDAVGRPWFWTDRKALSDDALGHIIGDERIEIYVLYVNGAPAGYFELDRRDPPDVNLAYFGIMPEYIGQRFGPYMLREAIDMAWGYEPRRLTVNTCTLDHPKALRLYQRFGFVPYDRAEATPPWLLPDTDRDG